MLMAVAATPHSFDALLDAYLIGRVRGQIAAPSR